MCNPNKVCVVVVLGFWSLGAGMVETFREILFIFFTIIFEIVCLNSLWG